MVDTSKHGGRNPLVDMVQEIDVMAGSGQDPRERELEELRGEKVADNWEDDPRISKKVAADPEKGIEAENAAGSFESFMRFMGVPPEQIASTNGAAGTED